MSHTKFPLDPSAPLKAHVVSEGESYTTEEAVELYGLLLNPGVGVRSDCFGDGFVATIFDQSFVESFGFTPIEAVRRVSEVYDGS